MSAQGVTEQSLAVTYSRMANATLPSARVRFTSEFGMGSGGTTPLWPPRKTVQAALVRRPTWGLGSDKVVLV